MGEQVAKLTSDLLRAVGHLQVGAPTVIFEGLDAIIMQPAAASTCQVSLWSRIFVHVGG
jgi:hypothetical protein